MHAPSSFLTRIRSGCRQQSSLRICPNDDPSCTETVTHPNVSLVRTAVFFFFFQAEDGIRDTSVTGVQTCALPISFSIAQPMARISSSACRFTRLTPAAPLMSHGLFFSSTTSLASRNAATEIWKTRSEERRVGKEGRYRWSGYHDKKSTRTSLEWPS